MPLFQRDCINSSGKIISFQCEYTVFVIFFLIKYLNFNYLLRTIYIMFYKLNYHVNKFYILSL